MHITNTGRFCCAMLVIAANQLISFVTVTHDDFLKSFEIKILKAVHTAKKTVLSIFYLLQTSMCNCSIPISTIDFFIPTREMVSLLT